MTDSAPSSASPRLTVRSWFVDGLTPDAPPPFAGSIPTSSLDFLTQLPPAGFTCWVRGRSGLVGIGRRVRLRARGETRFHELARQWDRLVAAAEVDDRVGLLGSGLVGFSAIAFAADSGVDSVIDVPEYLLGRRDGRVWLTHVSGGEDDPAEESVAGLQLTPTPLRDQRIASREPGHVSPERFEEIAAQATSRLRSPEAGERKIVLARDEVITAEDDIDVRTVLGRLNAEFPSTWTFLVAGLVGATPELLIGVEDGAVHSRVLAGTYRVQDDPEAEVAAARAHLGGRKDSVEHSYAIDSLASTLGPVTQELHVDPEPHLLQLANVIHLASDAHGRLAARADGSRISPFEVAHAVHPTAAVGGTPRGRAMDLISRLEEMDRGRYAGPVGWVDGRGNGQFGIALRCGQLEERNRIRLFAGAGIMPDSDPESERRETDAKFAPMRRALGVDWSPDTSH
ncbi:MAG TPA: isochorismate synthase [Brevibacterium sp.]|nr:isochorismate synthase [Brevibacterium sp.]